MPVSLTLRRWQQEFAAALHAHNREDFLLVACPAAGKTHGAGAAVAEIMRRRACDQLIVACPTVVVRDQWAHVLGQLGYRMGTDFAGAGWPEHLHGVCATYAQIANRARRYAAACRNRRTVAILDEVHHAGSELAWGAAIRDAFEGAAMRVALSGTPFRSDSSRIPFVTYDAKGECVADFVYSYSQAVQSGVCSPIHFRAHDGIVTWREEDENVTASFAKRLARPQVQRRLRAALDPSLPYLATVLADAHEDLLELRKQVPDAAGLVVCDTQEHAARVDALVTEVTGTVPTLATSDIPGARRAIASFASEDEAWLVSVRMVSEGVDIPRLGVIVWATAAKTELLFRQVVGRALRSRASYSGKPSVMHMPADPDLMTFAKRIHTVADVAHREENAGGSHKQGVRGSGSKSHALRGVDARPTGDGPRVIVPPLPEHRLSSVADPVEITTPALPPSPDDRVAAAQARAAAQAELYHLLTVYTQLRRIVQPSYQIAAAHAELAAAVGVVGEDADDKLLSEALDWIRHHSAVFAVRHPEAVREVARLRRRLAAA